MLIPIKPGLIVNTDMIAALHEMPATGESLGRTEIMFANGSRKVVNQRFDDFGWITGGIIPAPPGYSVIQAFPPEQDGDVTTFELYPVIALRISEREPTPITPFGKLDDHWALVWPDGRCDEQWNRLWPSVDAFKASFGLRGERS